MNPLRRPAPRNRRENDCAAPRATLALTPFYQRLIIINTLLSGTWLALDLVATARGH